MYILLRCLSCRGVRLEIVDSMWKRNTFSTPINSFSRKFDLANTNKRSSFLMLGNIQSTLSGNGHFYKTDTSVKRTSRIPERFKAASTRIQIKIRRLQKCPDS